MIEDHHYLGPEKLVTSSDNDGTYIRCLVNDCLQCQKSDLFTFCSDNLIRGKLNRGKGLLATSDEPEKKLFFLHLIGEPTNVIAD